MTVFTVQHSRPISLDLEVRSADNVGPARNLRSYVGAEFLWRISNRLKTQKGQFFDDVRQRDDARDLILELLDYFLRRSCWNHDSLHEGSLWLGQSRFCQCWHIRQRNQALATRHC